MHSTDRRPRKLASTGSSPVWPPSKVTTDLLRRYVTHPPGQRLNALAHVLAVPGDRQAIGGHKVAVRIAHPVLVAVRLQVVPHPDVRAARYLTRDLDHQRLAA